MKSQGKVLHVMLVYQTNVIYSLSLHFCADIKLSNLKIKWKKQTHFLNR